MELGEYPKAEANFERVLKVSMGGTCPSPSFENYIMALNGLALCYHRVDRLGDAKDFYERAISLFSQTRYLYN